MPLAELTFKAEVNGEHILVVVEPQVVNLMYQYRQLSVASHESGGVLIGEVRKGAIIIQEATRPNKRDHSSRYCFIRSKYHQKYVDKAYSRTNGNSNYVGEWHTHPQDIAIPSPIDYVNWSDSMRKMGLTIVAVIGNTDNWWGIQLDGQFIPLSLVY